MTLEWTGTDRLPDGEPDCRNREAYAHPQLLCGASADGRFVYDAVWVEGEEYFVLTLLHINQEWGFVEDEIRKYPRSRAELLAAVAAFQAAPLAELRR